MLEKKKTCHHIDYDLINTENSFFFLCDIIKDDAFVPFLLL